MSELGKQPLKIAIDGPGGVGKGTLARLLARILKLYYVDVGAFFRAAALLATKNNIAPADYPDLIRLISKTKFSSARVGNDWLFFLNDEDVSIDIRAAKVEKITPVFASIPDVHTSIVNVIRERIADRHRIIVDGRDVGKLVLPDADLKIWLTADEAERAKRRNKQNQVRANCHETQAETLRRLQQRDEMDKRRVNAPMSQPEDAWVIDNTDLTVEQTVYIVIRYLDRLGLV